MVTRNRTILYRKYKDALKSVQVPLGSSPSSSKGRPMIELSTTSFLNPNRSYAPLSTEDSGTSTSQVLGSLHVQKLVILQHTSFNETWKNDFHFVMLEELKRQEIRLMVYPCTQAPTEIDGDLKLMDYEFIY